MTRHVDTLPRLPLAALATLLATACAAKATPEPEPPQPAQEASTVADAPKPKVVTCSGDLEPAEDGLLDDFEDGDGQLTVLGERDGTWWTAHDDQGSSFTAPTGPFVPAEGGAASAKAAHVTGSTTSGGGNAWGVEFGANFLDARGGLYDASKYAGVSFKAKATGPTKSLRVNLGDVNTHADAGVCEQCWNHFRKDFTLSDQWQTYTMRFSESAQRPGWGKPRPASLTPSELVTLSFSLEGGQDFDVWVDDITLLTCAD